MRKNILAVVLLLLVGIGLYSFISFVDTGGAGYLVGFLSAVAAFVCSVDTVIRHGI